MKQFSSSIRSPGVILLDGDDDRRLTESDITGQGLQRLRWQRYEVESYLIHPRTLERFVEHIRWAQTLIR